MSVFPFLITFLVLRLIFWFVTFPNPDEAYYWLWGQHPGLSYYDHPPLHAWLQGLVTAIAGRSTFTLRLPNLLSNGIFFYTYYHILRYLYGENPLARFWLVALLILASPLYFLFLALAWHDHWLITFSLVSAYLFIRFLDGYLVDGTGNSGQLYAAAGALALAGLCKYNAVFVAIGFLATLLTHARLRPLFRDYRLYVAIAIAATALVPILGWNFSNDLQSVRYYVDRSVNTGSFSFKPASCLSFIIFSILTVSPMTCLGWVSLWQQRNQSWFGQSVYPIVAGWIFAISTGTLLLISLVSAALYYWNIVAYLLLFPLLPAVFSHSAHSGKWKRSRLLLAGQCYGLLFATLLVIHYGFLPLSALVSRDADPDSRMLFGWNAVGAEVQAQAAELGESPVLVTTDYRSASALAYQLHDRSVIAISDRTDQFDFWLGDRPLSGKTAILLSDDWHPLTAAVRSRFAQVSEPTIVPVTRFGVWIKQYLITKARFN